ncbi:sulfatase-like hydrolase/transferase [Ningiella sp. W23]|uniref:sulfatase-like hydrolase/transferase n=1 Tax=Ningiella sp. W23 TaxID=3023715 RepID=UPI003757EA44
MFWLALLTINVLSFLPFYLLNTRQQANPFSFLFEKRARHRTLRDLLFTKLDFSDPFRLQFEYCFILLLLLLVGAGTEITVYISSFVLLISVVYSIYLSVMLFIFSRTPAFLSDFSLIKTGIVVFKARALALIFIVVLIVLTIAYGILKANSFLVSEYAAHPLVTLSALALLIGFGVFEWSKGKKKKHSKRAFPVKLMHWRNFRYADLHWRNVFSFSLHIFRNLMFCQKYKPILTQSVEAFQSKNLFSNLQLNSKPNFVFLCIESYGARIYQDPKLAIGLKDVIGKYSDKFDAAELHVSSHFSTAPIYSGGSWLSYCTFMYGTKIENIQLYETLFNTHSHFDEYQSIFHLLHANDYENVLSCPMGGVDNKDVNWDSIKRCFQSDHIIDWDSMDFKGHILPFFGLKQRYCAPDQYVINHTYDFAKKKCDKPFSMFYCTMNSHIPWISPLSIAEDWRVINSKAYRGDTTKEKYSSNHDKYIASIAYQLECVMEFALEHQEDDMVLVVFGDHQPPLIAIPRMGLETPVHVISKNERFISSFREHGFIKGINLRGHKGNIRHEGFMSIFANACASAYGKSDKPSSQRDSALVFPVLPDGVQLIDNPQSKIG